MISATDLQFILLGVGTFFIVMAMLRAAKSGHNPYAHYGQALSPAPQLATEPSQEAELDAMTEPVFFAENRPRTLRAPFHPGPLRETVRVPFVQSLKKREKHLVPQLATT